MNRRQDNDNLQSASINPEDEEIHQENTSPAQPHANVPPALSTNPERAWLETKMGERLQQLTMERRDRAQIRSRWATTTIQNETLIKVLFGVFTGKCEFDVDFVERNILPMKSVDPQLPFAIIQLSRFPDNVSTHLAKLYVDTSVLRRMKLLQREIMTCEMIIDSWKGISLDSDQLFYQLLYLFKMDDLQAVKDYELTEFLETSFVFTHKLKYHTENEITLPDGQKFGLWRKSDYGTVLPWCEIDFRFLQTRSNVSFDEFVLSYHWPVTSMSSIESDMPEFLRKDSLESILFKCFETDQLPPRSPVDTTSLPVLASQDGSKSTSNESELVAAMSNISLHTAKDLASLESTAQSISFKDSSLRTAMGIVSVNVPPNREVMRKNRMITSILEAATKARKSQLLENMIPETWMDVWDEKNDVSKLSLFETEDSAETNPHQSSASEDLTIEAKSAGLLRIEYFDFMNQVDMTIVETGSWVPIVRPLLQWCSEIVFDTKDYELAVRILPMLERKMTKTEIILFMYFDRIKHIRGSLQFLLNELNKLRFSEAPIHDD